MSDFLPMTKEEMSARGWSSLDVIIVTGDAYVDHPSYGGAVIGRVLEAEGYKVGIIAQPDLKNPDSLKRLGGPRLFFGVTAGNLDSMIANYTANKKFRSEDEYSPGGKTALRPDRATLIYTNKIRQAFDNVPIVIGGIEAGMRRLAHYDYWSDTVRRSILLDSKADILVYGMGERQIAEIARRLRDGERIKDLNDIRGTVIVRNSIGDFNDAVSIPSFEEVSSSKDKFNEAFRLAYIEQDPVRGRA
ncbi:MAG: YgiQ family radical SAM protein, partial [Candidatus Omnitrophota bacterium]